MSRIKPVTLVLPNAGAAKAMADEYEYIGRATRVRGRFVTVLLTTVKPKREPK